MQNHTTNHKDSTSNDPPVDVEGSTSTDSDTDAKGTPTEEVNSYCSMKANSRNHVLLAAAIVEVMNKAGQFIPCRALLDSGSQTHFITERCVQRLKLSKNRMNASIKGISDVNTATSHSASIHFRSRVTDWHATIDCPVLSNITSTTPPTKIDISTWKIPKDLILAYETFNVPGKIDLLIGADIFYEILRSDNRTRPDNYPVLQETALGWIISGRTPAVTTCDSQHTLLLRKGNSPSHNFNYFLGRESVEQFSIPTKQQNCETFSHKC
jgi:hypothetical protein